MPEFLIHYTKISYCSCVIEAQNEKQVRHLFDHEMLDLNNEHHGQCDFGELRSVEKVK